MERWGVERWRGGVWRGGGGGNGCQSVLHCRVGLLQTCAVGETGVLRHLIGKCIGDRDNISHKKR